MKSALRLGLPLSLLLAAAVLHVAAERLDSAASSPFPLHRDHSFRAASTILGAELSQAGVVGAGLGVPLPLLLRRGDTLASVLGGMGVAPEEVHGLALAMAEYVDPRLLRPDDCYTAFFGDGSDLTAFELELSGKGRVRLARGDRGWEVDWHPYERTVESRAIEGRLAGFLESAVRKAGGEPVLAYRMAEVLQWDLDFNRDLQEGDTFQVLYEEVLLDGEFHSIGKILALVYENRGKRLEAYRFGEDGGYYNGEGRPLQKMFLRSPLPYSRVTSRFSHRRFHPVLKSYRAHYGVDYGAPVGTPVRVTANGVVAFAGWDGGGGRTVKVRHANDYLTAYLHLSRFASGIRPGKRVGQGDVIGYVGATGLATGPHLDYRIQHRRRWIDPLLLKSVPAEPILDADLPDFLARRDQMRTRLSAEWPPPEPRSEHPMLATARVAAGPELTAR